MSWIKLVGVCLNVVKGCLLHKGGEHAYQQLLVREVPLHPTKVAVYANERFVVPPGGRVAPFDKGHLGIIIQAKLNVGLMASLPIYLDSNVGGELAPWTVYNTTTALMSIKTAAQVRTWTAIQEIVLTYKLPTHAYACFLLLNLASLVEVSDGWGINSESCLFSTANASGLISRKLVGLDCRIESSCARERPKKGMFRANCPLSLLPSNGRLRR